MVTHTSTRDKILEHGMELLQVRGFNGFSYQDLAERLDIRKASIHHHFATKEDLGIALADTYRDAFIAWAGHTEGKYPGATERVAAYFRLLLRVSGQGDRVCPAGAYAADWNTLSEPVQKAVNRFFATARGWLVQVVEQGQQAGEFTTAKPATDLADLVISAAQGGLLFNRVAPRTDHFEAVSKTALALLKP
jgi:TetR/AcrR family transcriptional repressor of nem operon